MNEIILSNTILPAVEDFGLIAASESFYHIDRTAPFNVMIYVTDGVIYVTEDEIDYEVRKGEVLFLKSGVHHYGKYEIERGTRWYYAHFYSGAGSHIPASSAARDYAQTLSLPKKLIIPENSAAAEIIERYNNDFCSGSSAPFWKVNADFFNILTELAFINRKENIPQTLSERICGYLASHCCEPFSAKKTEQEFYLSYKYMAAVFKKEQRQTMQQYHTKIRINTACRLLRSTLMPIAGIAEKLGYNDALYFSRCFHSVVGISPSSYRKNISKC